MSFKHWLHHLINPHCELCKSEREDKEVCKSCEILQAQLNIANYNNQLILKTALAIPEPQEQINTENLQPIRPFVPFRVRREALEQLDRAKAKSVNERKEHAAADSPAN